MPTADDGTTTFVQRMTKRAAHLVTRVRLQDPTCLDQAACFHNAKEIDIVDKEAVWSEKSARNLVRFPHLETLVMDGSNVLDHSFLAHLPHLRHLDLRTKFGLRESRRSRHWSTWSSSRSMCTTRHRLAVPFLEQLSINVHHALSTCSSSTAWVDSRRSRCGT